MADIGAFRSTTFKPTIDKWIARDGVPVVLWNDGEELLVLHYRDREWMIATHTLAEAKDGPGRYFRGNMYSPDGTILLRLSESATDAEWAAAYDEYFERQKSRLLMRLAEPTGPLATV